MMELYRNAIEAVRLWVEDAEADGEKLPRPHSLDAFKADSEIAAALARGAALMVVPLVRDVGRAAKANVSMDVGMLEAIDEEASARGLTRSAFHRQCGAGEDPPRDLSSTRARHSHFRLPRRLDHHLSTISTAAKLRTAIARNIFVSVGICATKSIIRQHDSIRLVIFG